MNTNTTANKLWADSDAITGDEPTNKAELLNKPFLITGVEFTIKPNKYGVDYAHARINAIYRDGTDFWFQDASTGICSQLVDYITGKGTEIDYQGGFYPLKLRCLNGLRVSEYDVPTFDNHGTATGVRPGKTYYIVTERDH